MCQGTVRFSL